MNILYIYIYIYIYIYMKLLNIRPKYLNKESLKICKNKEIKMKYVKVCTDDRCLY